MKHHLPLLCALLLPLLTSCGSDRTASTHYPDDLTQYVDPWIGSGDHGHVFVGASVPYGMVQVGPTSIPEGWDWVSGYHHTDSTVIGFSHTHFSGTGIGDLLDITVMPTGAPVPYGRGTADDPESGQWSYSLRSSEVVRPGYYSTTLTRHGIGVELTATTYMAMHHYTYSVDHSEPAILFDMVNGGNWDKATSALIRQVDAHTIEGYRYSTGWAKDQKVYFVAQFEQPIKHINALAEDDIAMTTRDTGATTFEATGSPLYASVVLDLSGASTSERSAYMRLALSPTSIADAHANLQSEISSLGLDAPTAATHHSWSEDFAKVRTEATQSWQAELSRVRISSSDTSVLRSFYTALYHALMAPSVYANSDGSYMGADLVKHPAPGYTTRTTLSLWDTYRAAHPLYTLILPDHVRDYVGTFLAIHDEQGKLPVWHFYGNETNTMVGNPGIPVLADALLKGFVPEGDRERAYQALKASAMMTDRGQEARMQYGYIPYDTMLESVAYDMEYAIADDAVARVAKALGHQEDYTYFLKRSRSYRHLFDPVTGFMRGKGTNGEWHEPFNPFYSNHREDDYCEGNAWQYTFLVPHDVPGLVECFGGEERFLTKLDSLFVLPSEIHGAVVSPDISGLIGQYAHGNEPSHHILYIYSVLGHQAKGAPLIRQVMRDMYRDEPAGISGNEDVGQMSAWYILSALGLYQINPADGKYYFGTPLVDAAELSVRDGKFEITVRENSDTNIYIQSIQLNGTDYTERYLTYEDIAKGGHLVITMGSTPHSF